VTALLIKTEKKNPKLKILPDNLSKYKSALLFWKTDQKKNMKIVSSN